MLQAFEPSRESERAFFLHALNGVRTGSRCNNKCNNGLGRAKTTEATRSDLVMRVVRGVGVRGFHESVNRRLAAESVPINPFGHFLSRLGLPISQFWLVYPDVAAGDRSARYISLDDDTYILSTDRHHRAVLCPALMDNAEVRQIVGRTIRKYRKALDLSQEELAARADVHRTYLGGIERGERNPSLTNLVRIALALEVHPQQLLADLPDPSSHDV